MAGAAIATVISQCLGLTVNIIILIKKIRVRMLWHQLIRWSSNHVKHILKVGIPSSAAQLSYSGQQIVITAFIASLGAELLTTKIYTQNIMFFTIILALSFGRGMQIIIGHLIGAGEKDEAYNHAIRNLSLSILMTLAFVSMIALFRKPLLHLFTDDPKIVTLGATLLLLGFVLEPGRNFNVILERSLQATGDVRFPMYVSILVIWSFSLPLTYVLGVHFGFGLLGIWVAFIIDEWIRGFILLLRWRSRVWERKALVQQDQEKATNMAMET